jgi:hypothetical protein
LSNVLIRLLSDEHAKKYGKLVDEDSDEEVDLSDEESDEPTTPRSPVSVTRKKSFH